MNTTPTVMEWVLHNLVGARTVFFNRWHHDNVSHHYLRNETRMLDMIDYFLVRNAVRTVAGLNATVQIPIPQNFADPVIVAPTQAQMDAAFQVLEQNPEGACPICQEAYVPNAPVVRLRHCHHAFHQQCASAWYTMSVRCPLCRHDIRETQNNER